MHVRLTLRGRWINVDLFSEYPLLKEPVFCELNWYDDAWDDSKCPPWLAACSNRSNPLKLLSSCCIGSAAFGASSATATTSFVLEGSVQIVIRIDPLDIDKPSH